MSKLHASELPKVTFQSCASTVFCGAKNWMCLHELHRPIGKKCSVDPKYAAKSFSAGYAHNAPLNPIIDLIKE